MSFAVKEIFYTLQGEGFHTGRPAVFCRFSGCNLWSGREEDREFAKCRFCDTDFLGADDWAEHLKLPPSWPRQSAHTFPAMRMLVIGHTLF